MRPDTGGGAPTCAGPDRNPRPPRLASPAGATDCHAHVFGPSARFAYTAARAYTPPDSTVMDYLAMLDALGLARGVLAQPSVYGDDNSCLVDALEASGGRLRGIVVADPRKLSDRTVETWSRAGVCGIRLNMVVGGGLPLDEIEAMAGRLTEIGWHLDIILDTSARLAELRPRLERLHVPLMIEQMGRVKGGEPLDSPGFQALLALLRGGNSWVKLSHAYHISAGGPPYADTTRFARAIVAAAPDRAVWGSDWPHPMLDGPMPNDGTLLDLLADWVPDAGQRARVLTDNPARLYGFGPP